MTLRETYRTLGAPSPETLAFNEALEELLKPAPPPGVVPVEELRRLRAEGLGLFPIDIREDSVWREFDSAALGAPGGPGRIRVTEHPAPKGVHLHIHGGGWSLGTPEHFDGRNRRLADAAEMTVLAAQYRLAPEHPWPACADDCLAAAKVAIDMAKEAGLPLFIGGESAGAHLAVVTLLRLRDELGVTGAFRGAVLTYGCFDLRMTPSMANWGARNMILSTPVVAWFIENLLPDPALASDPLVSPLLADLRDMPPALFQCGDVDPLLDDSCFMAQRWRAAGVPAELTLYPGGVHAFDLFDAPGRELKLGMAAQQETADRLRAFIAAG